MSEQTMRRKSSRSSSANACVELAVGTTQTSVRDSKAPEVGRLTFKDASYKAILDAMKDGELDRTC
jgi:hypothetical protein